LEVVIRLRGRADSGRYFAHEIMTLTLNGFRVDPKLESVMLRDDWPGKRSHENWLNRFPGHPESSGIRIVEFCAPDRAIRENRGIQHHRFLGLFGLGRRDDIYLNGKPDADSPPGDFDPWNGYLIGFTDYCDAGIFIDLRPHKPRVIYDTLNPTSASHATAFDTIDEFIDYCGQHLHQMERKLATE
jgi:hypothetical protein